MSERTYGDTDVIQTRTAATPATFGFDEEADGESPEAQLEAFIEQLQARASSEVERYTNIRFDEHQETTELVESTGREHISTRNDPVREIHSLEVGTTSLEEDDYRVVPVQGNPDENIGRLQRLRGGPRRRPGRWRPGAMIEITYDWGYDDETRPAVVDQVVEDMVVSVLNEGHAERDAAGKQSESMDGYSVQWDLTDATERLTLTESMQESLKPLRRRGAA